MRKTLFLFLLTCVLVSLIGKSESPAQTPLQKVAISTSSPGIFSIDLSIAQDRGFFREEGLDLQLVKMRASTAIAAGISGNVDAQILKLPEPVDPSTVFDFSLQRDVNHELGIK